jgi:hypothetical protein
MSNNDEGHNGFVNFETWAAMLWINNSQSMQEFVHNIVTAERRDESFGHTHPRAIGEKVLAAVQATLFEDIEMLSLSGADVTQSEAFMFLTEVGSWQRVDEIEVGESLITDVQEMLG